MGSTTLRELLDSAERDDVIGKMKVVSVLESLPGVGKVKARRYMEDDRHQRHPPGPRARRSAARGAAQGVRTGLTLGLQ